MKMKIFPICLSFLFAGIYFAGGEFTLYPALLKAPYGILLFYGYPKP